MSSETHGNLQQHVTELIANVTGRDVEELKPDANLWQDLGIDSIKAIEIAVAIEKKFNVRIPDDQIPQIVTIEQAVQVIQNLLEEKPDED